MRGESTTGAGGSRGAIDAIAFERDRDRVFRRARRHTYLVRGLRLVLPALALVSVAVYGASLLVTSRLTVKGASVGAVSIDPTNLTMADPSYSGFGKDGSEFRVHAKSAVTDLKMTAPVRLDVIDADILQLTGVATKLTAKWGTYDQKKDILELYERIDVGSTNGLKAKLTRATVLTKESRITSPEPVWAENDTSTIRANSMALDTKSKKAAFREAVEVTLKPSKPAAALKGVDETPAAAKPKAQPQPFGLDANSGEPVVVTSRTLDVDDLAKTALFREAVVARQGEAELRAPELDVLYAGQASMAPGAEPAKPAADGASAPAASPADATKLKKIKARGGVIMTSKGDRADSETMDYDAELSQIALAGKVVMTQQPDRRVTSEAALLDQKADTALLTGDVVVNQGRNIMRGGRLAIDRKAGTAKLATPAVPGGPPAGRIFTLFYQNQEAKAAAAKPEAPQPASPLGVLGGGFKTDPNAPIEVESVTLDVNDKKHVAIYIGGVVAKQGLFVVKTEEMTAHYAGNTGLLASAQPVIPAAKDKAKAKGAGIGPGSSELKRIEARRHVVVTGTDGQQASGEWADFDVKANRVVMGGNVTVAQGKQIVHAPDGNRLVIDLNSGQYTIEADQTAGPKTGPQTSSAFATSAAAPAGAPGASPIACPKGAICNSNRVGVILYPNEVKDKAKQKVDEVGAKGAAAVAKEAVESVAKRLPAASSWTPATRTPSTP